MKSTRRVSSHKLADVGILMSTLCLGLLAYGQGRDTAQATGGSGYELSWFTIDGGGAMFSGGGDYELSGTIGQPDAGGPMFAGDLELAGGLWFPQVPGDCVFDGGVNLVDFDELAGCAAGPDSPLSPPCACYDLDRDGDVDLLDFAEFQRSFSGS